MGQMLTTLERVKIWLKSPTALTDADPLLKQLIEAASAFILNYTNRETFAAREITDVYDTFGNNFLVLREAPVQSVVSLGFSGLSLNPSVGSPRSPGYLLDRAGADGSQQRLTLFGYSFPNGRSETEVTYVAGYQERERRTIPAAAPYTLEPQSFWANGRSVEAFDGTPFVEVGSNPGAGQYVLGETGIYTFSAADAGATVFLTYGTVPADIVQAATELVGERFKTKDRIGQSSQSLAGKESVAYFSTRDMNAFVTSTLRPYRRVSPA